jgi:hypothetical protein
LDGVDGNFGGNGQAGAIQPQIIVSDERINLL